MSHLCCLVGLAALLLGVALPALAMPAITCHCFTERAYDAARPAAADPYFLAATQNAFVAAVFSADKKTIVMKKQQGASADDLWVAYWLASRSAATPDELLQAKMNGGSWPDVVASLTPAPTDLGVSFSRVLAAKAPAEQLSAAVVDEVFGRYRLLDAQELAALRQAGASNQEVIIATVLAARTKRPAGQLHHEVKAGGVSWGALLTAAGIDAKTIHQGIAGLLSPANPR